MSNSKAITEQSSFFQVSISARQVLLLYNILRMEQKVSKYEMIGPNIEGNAALTYNDRHSPVSMTELFILYWI